MSDAARATLERVETALERAGWRGQQLNVGHGVVSMTPVAPTPDNLARLARAWRFDEPTSGWAADSLSE